MTIGKAKAVGISSYCSPIKLFLKTKIKADFCLEIQPLVFFFYAKKSPPSGNFLMFFVFFFVRVVSICIFAGN